MRAVCAAVATAIAAWLSQGTLAYTGNGLERIALLPLSVSAIAICLAAGGVVYWMVRRGAAAWPIALFLLLLLPWLPVPPAFQLWTGGLVLLVWLAVAAVLVVSRPIPLTASARPGARTAGVLAFLIGLVAWWQVSPQVPGGDEPHYLVITQSLLKDGDLKIENNHRQRDYRSYFAGELPPDFRVRGRDKEIYSIHAPGVSALVAPAFVIGGYPASVLFLLTVSALGAALAWHLAWMVTRRQDAAWFGWAAMTFSTTWIFHSFTIYPDGPGAVLLLTGAWALLRFDREIAEKRESAWPWFWHGAALALLPWMHTRFSVLAAGVGALVLLRLSLVPNAAGKALAFLIVPMGSCLLWILYFVVIYGTPDPSAPYGGEEGSFEFVPGGLAGLFFDQRFGLFAYAPVLICAIAGIGVMLARRAWRRHALEMLFVMLPYLLVVTYVAMWWGGRSAPARFLVPLLPWLVIPAAACWTAMTLRVTRVTALAGLVFTLFASCVLVFSNDGAFAFNVREMPAQWLEWLNGTIDLAHALPLWNQFRDTQVPIFRSTVIWLVTGGGAWLLLRTLERRKVLGDRARTVAAVTIVFALAASVAVALNWKVEKVDGRVTTPSQLEALRRVSAERRLLAMQLSPLQRIARSDVAPKLTLRPDRATAPGGAGRNDRPLYSIPAIPAGDYEVRPTMTAANGWVMIGIGRDQFAIQTTPLAEIPSGTIVRFPVDVRALILRGDEAARRSISRLEVKPLRLVLPEERITGGYARHAVRYGNTTTYFMDEESYPEPQAFWVRGETTSEVVIQPDTPHPAEVVLLRNGASENTVLISSGRWREEMRLGPGEERTLQVPLDLARGATAVRIRTSAGFTPSAVDPTSRDNRYLGVWVKVGG
jgi:hypothetical protein